MSRQIIHMLILIAVISLSFLVVQTPLRNYYIEITAATFIVYFLCHHIFKLSSQSPFMMILYSSIFTFAMLYTVLSTGGMTSPYFFFIYFLLFALSIMLEPVVAFTSAVSITLLFFVTSTAPHYSSLISLPFIVPFALYLGQEHKMLQRAQSSQIVTKNDTFMFLSTVVKGHLDELEKHVMNFKGDNDLTAMLRSIRRTKKLVDEFEKTS